MSEAASHIVAAGEAGFSTTVKAGEVLHIWHRAPDAKQSSELALREADGTQAKLTGPASDDFQMTAYMFKASGEMAVAWDDAGAVVSVAYVYDPALVMEEGIRVLWARRETAANTNRFRLHLAPPFGWMNDPNGLISLSGRTHCFYQHYPHLRRWDTMHWGHATSRNLVDWTHLPVFLHPQAQMLADATKKGGAFSGSAIANAAGGLRIFHTDREDHRLPEQEWQMTAISSDFITASASRPVLQERPPLPDYGADLRDPYVFKGPDGLWKMVLGGADEKSPLVLLYETEDPDAASGWHYTGVLHREIIPAVVPAECPCLVPLTGEGQGLYALVFGLIGHQIPVQGRLNPSFALVGKFDGRTFTEIWRRELDFVGDCYAFQGFLHETGPMGFSWAANWAEVRKSPDFSTAMTFPRRLVWQDGALLMPPAEAVRELRLGKLAETPDALARGIALPEGLAEVSLEFAGPVRLTLSHSDGPITLAYDGSVLELSGRKSKPRPGAFQYRMEAGQVRRLTLFIDVGLLEIYADDGRLCGTKRLDSDDPVTALRLESDAHHIQRAEIWQLRPQKGAPGHFTAS